ncbi:Npt1/Npt2 family nucleotide transporter [Paenibacillus sp. MBLB4367]|uniref:Npt1/Npt2 family nucleotide transporter n=1 Tax=Paenibacillus sp. MBLB4367 TaxID=3384767 RepID=UPI0039081066
MKASVFEAPLQAFLQKFAADREEYVKVFLLFGYLFCVVSASTIGRTAADTLFLSHFDASRLSFMYLPQSAALLLAGVLYQRFCSKLRPDRLNVSVIASVSVLVVVTRLLAGFGFQWIYPAMYIGYDVFNFLMIVCFWQFATSVMDQRKAKRMIGLVGSGGIVGGIVSGFGLKALVHPLGTLNLIFVYAALQLLCLVWVRLLVKRLSDPAAAFAAGAKPRAPGQAGSKRKREETGGLFRSAPHLKYVAVIAATVVLSLTIIDYQFKVVMRGTLQNEALAGFMGNFYGISGILALLVQLFVSGKIISRFGVMTALLLFPAVLFAGASAFLFLPALAVAAAVKGSDKVVGDTVYSSVSQLVMFPVSPEHRSRAKGFLDGIVRNGAKGIAGVSLMILPPFLQIHQFSFIVLGLLALCIAAAVKVKQPYMQTLLSSLQTRELDFQETGVDLMDAASRKVLTDALQSPDPIQAAYALKILQSIHAFDLTPYVPGLLRHPAAEVRVEGLKWIQRHVPQGMEPHIEAVWQSFDTGVKPYAVLAMAAYADAENLERIAGLLEERDVKVKAAAIAGLIKYYGIEGMFRAVGPFRSMLESEREKERIEVALIFGQIGIAGFYKPLLSLLEDRSPHVRNAALESAGLLQVPELVPAIVPMLKPSETREQAAHALAGYDENKLLPLLEPYFPSNDETAAVEQTEGAAAHLPGVLERVGTLRAFELLIGRYEQASADLRSVFLSALARMFRRVNGIDRGAVERLVLHEADLFAHYAEQGEGLQGIEGLRYANETIQTIRTQTVRRAFQLLALLYDSKTVQAVYAGWEEGDARRQANAAEVADQLLQGAVRTEVLKMMAFVPAAAHQPPAKAVDSRLVRLYERDGEWLRACIAYGVYVSPGSGAWPEIAKRVERLPQGSRERICEQVEQVVLLRNIGIFAGLQGKDLSVIASYLQQVDVLAGEAVIREMEEGSSLYVIREGRAVVSKGGTALGALQTGDCFGEMAVLTQSVRTATVHAESNLRLWRLESEAFYEMAFDKTEIALELMRLLSQRLRSVNQKYGRTLSADMPGYTADGSYAAAAREEGMGEGANAGNRERPTGQEEPVQTNSGILLRRMLVLQKIDLFAHASQEDVIRLAHMVDETVYESGETICAAGDEGDALFGIIEGGVRVHRGEETLAMLEVGACFGEMAIIDDEPRSADCTAEGRTVLLKLTKEQVLGFCFRHTGVLRSMMRVLAERLKDTQSRG